MGGSGRSKHPAVVVLVARGNRRLPFLVRPGLGGLVPVVPRGKARIRTQMSSALTQADLDHTLESFAKVKAELGI